MTQRFRFHDCPMPLDRLLDLAAAKVRRQRDGMFYDPRLEAAEDEEGAAPPGHDPGWLPPAEAALEAAQTLSGT